MPHPSRLARLDLADYRLPADVRARLQSPALLVDLEKVRHNLQQMLRYLGGDPRRWRPHLKTTKLPEVWAELWALGVREFKCATSREASVLLRTAAERGWAGLDLLVAYAHRGPNLARIAALARAHPAARVSVLSEEAGHAAAVPEELGVYVDVNPQMDRTGIPMAEAAVIEAVAAAAGKRLRGLHFYDGHIRDPQREAREQRAHGIYAGLLELHARLTGAGLPVGELITSGTPAFPYALSFAPFVELASDCRHRVSPGTVVFHDQFSEDLLEDVGLEPAAVLFCRVVSRPRPGRLTCDAGSKSLAAEAGDPAAFVIGHPELIAQKPSEEHLPLEVEGAVAPELGADLYLVPRHVCPTVNLAEEVVLLDGPAAPRAVPVRARAHEVWLDF